jgi:hypothetical protein
MSDLCVLQASNNSRVRNSFLDSYVEAGQFQVFGNFLSVVQGLNAKNQKAMKFRPGKMANKHQTG